MGKPFPSATKLQEFARLLSSEGFRGAKQRLPTSQKPSVTPKTTNPKSKSKSPTVVRVDSDRLKLNRMESSASEVRKAPLSGVVNDCVRRWFQDTLKEAKAGDVSMQVLVGQMYFSGYGVPRDPSKGQAWISRASKCRSSAWKVSDKRPGYNASDSDSDEVKADA